MCEPQKLGYIAAHYDAEARRKRGEKQVYCCERGKWIWADEICTDKRCRILTEDAYKRMVKEAKEMA